MCPPQLLVSDMFLSRCFESPILEAHWHMAAWHLFPRRSRKEEWGGRGWWTERRVGRDTMISPQDRCLFFCVSSTRSAHKKPFHSNKTALCVWLRVPVHAFVRMCACAKFTERVSHWEITCLRANGEHSRRLSCQRRVCRTQSQDVKVLVELVLMQSMLRARGFCSHRRDRAWSHTCSYAGEAAHTQPDSTEKTAQFTQFIQGWMFSIKPPASAPPPTHTHLRRIWIWLFLRFFFS